MVLTRKKRQMVVIGDSGGQESLLVIAVLEISGGGVRIGFTTTSTVPVHRGEMWTRPGAGSRVPHSLRGRAVMRFIGL